MTLPAVTPALSSTPVLAGIAGSFTSTDTNPADFSALVFWSDGTASAGLVSSAGKGLFDVFAAHQEAVGVNPLFVSVTDVVTGAQSTILWTAQPTSLPFNDTFAGNQLSANWVDQSGGFVVNNNQATGVSATNAKFDQAMLDGVLAANVNVQANVTLTAANQTAGLLVRVSDQGDHGYVGEITQLSGGKVQAAISRWDNGVLTPIGTGTTVAGTGGTLDFEAEGADLKLFLNGNLVANAQDTSYTTGTIGMRANAGATLANYQADTVTLANASLPYADNFAPGSFGNQLSNTWQEQLGNFNVSTGAAVAQGSTLNIATLNGVTAGDVGVLANIHLTATNQNAGLLIRDSNAGFYEGMLIDHGNGAVQAMIVRNLGGTVTPIGTTQTVTGATGTLSLVFLVQGTSLKLFLNGSLVAAATDTKLTTGTVGIAGTAGASLGNSQAALAPVMNASLPYMDSFAGSQLGPVWNDLIGGFAVAGNQAAGLNASNLEVLNSVNAANVSVQANVTLTKVNQAAGLILRYAGPGTANMYVGKLTLLAGGKVQAAIYKDGTGAPVLIGVTQTVVGTGGTLIFQAEGIDLKLFLNGNLVAYAQDTTYTTGSVGVMATAGAALAAFQANPATIASVSLPFNDSFAPGSLGNQLSNSWQEEMGNFNVSTGAAKSSNIATASMATLNGVNAGNVVIQASVTFTTVNQMAALLARYVNASTYYMARLMDLGAGKVQAEIFRVFNGVATPVGTAVNVATGALNGGTFVFQLEGSDLKLFLNGNLVAYGYDTMIATGSIGIRADLGAALANFQAAPAALTSNTTPFSDNFAAPSLGNQLSSSWLEQVGNFNLATGAAVGKSSTTTQPRHRQRDQPGQCEPASHPRLDRRQSKRRPGRTLFRGQRRGHVFRLDPETRQRQDSGLDLQGGQGGANPPVHEDHRYLRRRDPVPGRRQRPHPDGRWPYGFGADRQLDHRRRRRWHTGFSWRGCHQQFSWRVEASGRPAQPCGLFIKEFLTRGEGVLM